MNKSVGMNIGELKTETFDQFRIFIQAETGIHLRDSKKILVSNRLRKRLSALAINSYEDYYKLLTQGDSEEKQNFIDAISTNETYFYRGGEQFESLRSGILPQLFKTRSTLKIWSAGSSSGEEPYSVLMAAEQAAKETKWSGKIELIATDINVSVLDAARKGLYSITTLRNLPDPFLSMYFNACPGDHFEVKDELKKKITFFPHNLLKDDAPDGIFDIIYCRNVLMYFARKTQESIITKKFAPALAKDGYLFIGSSESFVGIDTPFKYAHINGCPIYLLREGADS